MNKHESSWLALAARSSLSRRPRDRAQCRSVKHGRDAIVSDASSTMRRPRHLWQSLWIARPGDRGRVRA
jgi:hypothetical protein